MESSNMLDLHQQLFLLHAASTTLEYWNQDPSLLNGIELLQSSRDEQHLIDPSSFAASHHHHHMVQDLGLQWSGHKIKEELSVESFLKLEQCSHHEQLSSAVKHEEQRQLHDHDINSYNQLPSAPDPTSTVHGNLGLEYPLSFGMLLPTLNIQSSTYNDFPSMETSLCMDIDQASTRFGRIINAPNCQSSNMNASTFFDNMSYGLSNQLYSTAQGGFINLQENPPSVNEGKRVNLSSMDHLKPSKKPRFDSRPSLPPFKVRKEKLGDRIAALQQLVAPFGKTDTASVLMEAIGYIKFLQDQVETLSVPYMRPSNNRKLRATEEVSTTNERDDPKPDLRSRGLCLVPLSCTSYVTNDNAVWSPPNFR